MKLFNWQSNENETIPKEKHTKQQMKKSKEKQKRRTESVSIEVQTDLCMEDIPADITSFKQQVSDITNNVIKEQEKLALIWQNKIYSHETNAVLVNDNAAIEKEKIANLRSMMKELGTKLDNFFNLNLDKTTSLLKRLEDLHNEIHQQEILKDYLNHLKNEIDVKSGEIKETKSELKDEKMRCRNLEAKLEKAENKNDAEKEMIYRKIAGKMDELEFQQREAIKKINLVEEKQISHDQFSDGQTEAVTALQNELGDLKRQYNDTVAKRTGESREQESEAKRDVVRHGDTGQDTSETTCPIQETREFFVTFMEGEFEDLLQLPVQATMDEETEPKVYDMEDEYPEELDEFYRRQFEQILEF